MLFALVPSSFDELAIAAGAIIGGWLLVLIGNLVVGPKREGGMRLLIFAFGFGAFTLGFLIGRHFWLEFTTQAYPQVLGFYVGILVLALGVAGMCAAAFCANENIRSSFHHIIRGK